MRSYSTVIEGLKYMESHEWVKVDGRASTPPLLLVSSTLAEFVTVTARYAFHQVCFPMMDDASRCQRANHETTLSHENGSSRLCDSSV
jgi:hypothetical protein